VDDAGTPAAVDAHAGLVWRRRARGPTPDLDAGDDTEPLPASAGDDCAVEVAGCGLLGGGAVGAAAVGDGDAPLPGVDPPADTAAADWPGADPPTDTAAADWPGADPLTDTAAADWPGADPPTDTAAGSLAANGHADPAAAVEPGTLWDRADSGVPAPADPVLTTEPDATEPDPPPPTADPPPDDAPTPADPVVTTDPDPPSAAATPDPLPEISPDATEPTPLSRPIDNGAPDGSPAPAAPPPGSGA